MGKIKVLALGKSVQEQSRKRGKLFEQLMSEVLQYYGYKIDRIPNTNYSGMEIDIEGKHILSGISLYAECKCYEHEVDSPKLQAFFGKYMSLWLKDDKCHGIFIALPGINSHAKGFYRDNCEKTKQITINLLEEPDVIKAILQIPTIIKPDNISQIIKKHNWIPGDWLLLYTDNGLFWLQYIIQEGGVIPKHIVLFDEKGTCISERQTLDYLAQVYPELNDFEKINFSNPNILASSINSQDLEEIVEVQGSSSCFEYQFPASPKYFIGREAILKELDLFVNEVQYKKTSSRGLLFEANSGWGKSSVTLASVERLEKMGHFAISIDSRSSSSSQFLLRVIDYFIYKFKDFNGLISNYETFTPITGFDGAAKALINIAQNLEASQKIIFIFLDQFENIFFQTETLKRITNMFLKVCDAQTNVVFGFSWKTDLVGLTNEFPYQLRDTIVASSKRIALNTFSEFETTALLDKLGGELRAPLRKDLKFLLSEFSQGYPWLLKKLCAHIKAQREAGVTQLDIANSLLNVEELFQEDVRGLTPEEEDGLKRIAKSAPIALAELGEKLNPTVVQSLVNRRLVVRIGPKFDIYWDIFRDYLNAGRVPVLENYILRVQTGSIIKATKLLKENNGILNITDFYKKYNLSQKSFYNVLRDMRLLGLAIVDDDEIKLKVNLIEEKIKFEEKLRIYLKERLQCNRLIWRLLQEVEATHTLALSQVTDILINLCPYISASRKTWETYAKIFADWLDFSDLCIFDRLNGLLLPYGAGVEIRERRILPKKPRGSMMVPSIQYKPIEKAAIRIVQAIQENSIINWTGFKKSTINKVLATLENLEFISINRMTNSISLKDKCVEFVSKPEERPIIFAESALKMEFFKIFIDILKTHNQKKTLSELGIELKKKLNTNWKETTAIINVKIMLDWARHTNLAPPIFEKTGRGPMKGWKNKYNNNQILLFYE